MKRIPFFAALAALAPPPALGLTATRPGILTLGQDATRNQGSGCRQPAQGETTGERE